MSRERFTNTDSTTLDGSINDSTTTVVVTDGSQFPTSYFRILVESEIMLCTSRSSNTLTVVRGQEGTAGASHADDVPVNHIMTAGFLDSFKRDLLGDIGRYDTVTTDSSSDDDYFNDNSLDGSWTQVNSAVNAQPTLTEGDFGLKILLPSGMSSGGNCSALLKAKTPVSGDWVQAGFRWAGNVQQWPIFGVCFADGVTHGSGKQAMWWMSLREDATFLTSWNNFNSFGSGPGGNSGTWKPRGGNNAIHLRLEYLGSTNWRASYSPDGITWAIGFSSQSLHSFTPSYAGIVYTTQGAGANAVVLFDYCRFNF
jgi:hypothetical protein